jgi:hypothetical protein
MNTLRTTSLTCLCLIACAGFYFMGTDSAQARFGAYISTVNGVHTCIDGQNHTVAQADFCNDIQVNNVWVTVHGSGNSTCQQTGNLNVNNGCARTILASSIPPKGVVMDVPKGSTILPKSLAP